MSYSLGDHKTLEVTKWWACTQETCIQLKASKLVCGGGDSWTQVGVTPRLTGCFVWAHTYIVLSQCQALFYAFYIISLQQASPTSTGFSSHSLLEVIWRSPPGGFPDSSVGKESACKAGDSGSIPGSGRSTGEGIGYPLQYSWVSLVVQLVKNPSAVWETWFRSLGWEDTLEKGKATHSSVSGLQNSMDYTVHGVTESDTTEQLSLHFTSTRGQTCAFVSRKENTDVKSLCTDCL